MRKVVTGEQVAQLYNPDPFARPRSGGPRSTGPRPGSSLLVQLARLVAWLVRLVVRHPVAAAVLAVLVLAWLNVGLARPGRPGRLVVAVVLVVLAVVLAGLVRPVGQLPRRGASGGPGSTGAAGPR